MKVGSRFVTSTRLCKMGTIRLCPPYESCMCPLLEYFLHPATLLSFVIFVVGLIVIVPGQNC
jgi:hypothetical protein